MSGYVQFDKDLKDDGRVLALGDAMFEHMVETLSLGERNALRNAETFARNAAHNAVLGALARLWWYADSHVRSDNTLNVSLQHLADLIRCPEHMLRKFPPEWLRIHDSGLIELPDYIEKNSLIDKDIRREKDRESNRVRQARYRQRMAEEKARNRNALRNGRVTKGSNGGVTPSRAHERVCAPNPSQPIPTHTQSAEPDGVRVPRGTESEEAAESIPGPKGLVDFKLAFPDADQPHSWRRVEPMLEELLASGVVTWDFLVEQASAFAERCRRKKTIGGRYVMSPYTWISEGHYATDWAPNAERGREADDLAKLTARRAAIGLADFREPHEGETSEQYRKAQDEAWKRQQVASVKPRDFSVPPTLSGPSPSSPPDEPDLLRLNELLKRARGGAA